jgi:hypothetical protein
MAGTMYPTDSPGVPLSASFDALYRETTKTGKDLSLELCMSCVPKRSLTTACLGLLLVAFAGRAAAQTPHQIVPLITSASQIDQEGTNQFGTPNFTVTNDAGDFAFIGLRGTGIYYRKAGTPAAVRVLQFGDELPGWAGSRLNLVQTIFMNPSGLIVAGVEVSTTNRITRAILSYDGTTLKTIVTGLDTAPGTGGAKYARSIVVKDLNANGDVLFTSDLLPLGSTAAVQTTAFLAAAGGGITRVAGPGDASPGTGGTFSVATGIALNSVGDVLVQANITGGSGATGVFVWNNGTLRKVVAQGDANPLGGTFTSSFASATLRLNNSGLVMFLDLSGSIYQNTAGNGTTAAVAVGSAVPAPMNGTFSNVSNFAALSQSGDAVFIASVTGGASASGLFRFRAGSGVEVVARLNEAAPNGGGKVFSAFASISVNASGTVAFQGSATSSGAFGLFRKVAGQALGSVVLTGDATPVGGTYFINNFPTVTLTSGDVFCRTQVMNFSGEEAAHHGAFVFTPGAGAVALMSTADELPAGATLVVRPLFLTGAGSYIGVDYQRAGGRESIAVLNVATQQGEDLGTDGSFVNGIGGRLQFNTVNTVMVGAGGHVVAQVNVFDGNIRPAILIASLGGMDPVFANGFQDTGGRTLFSPQLADTTGVRPIAVNSTGQVVFTATFNNNRGVWVGTGCGTPVKVAINGDAVSTARPSRRSTRSTAASATAAECCSPP